MDNLLPKFSTFSLSEEGVNHPSQWRPQQAIIEEKSPKFSRSIPPPTSQHYVSNVLPPNERYKHNIHESDDPSPLSLSQRGSAETPKMNFTFPKGSKQAPNNDKLASIIKIQNGGLYSMQLFYQNTSDVLDLPLLPGESETRFPNGKFPKDESMTSTFEIFLSTARRLSVVMSLRQNIQTHIFRPGSIGIEVEMKNNKLLCTRVFEGSQAWSYIEELLNSEIIAVNGERVITLAEFGKALGFARERGSSITLQVISNLTRDDLLDDLITFHKKSRKMAKLVSGAFEESSLADDLSFSSKIQIDSYDNIDLGKETKNQNDKKKGIIYGGDDVVDSKGVLSSAQRMSNYSRFSESSGSLYIDPAEEAAAQEALLANPRRTSTVVHDSLEYLQEIGHGTDVNDDIPSNKRLTSAAEHKVAMPPLAEVEPVEEAASDRGSEDELVADGKERTAWDYATALDENDVTSHRHLVCVPKSLKFSENGWSNPSRKSCMQIGNYSQEWILDIAWVGEDCGLVSRAVLNSGDTHFEQLSSDHVWCLTALRKPPTTNQLLDQDFCQKDEAGNFVEDVPDFSATCLLYRPPSTENSTQFSPATSVIWVPWHSVAFAECTKQVVNSNFGSNETIDLLIKVFDSTRGDSKNPSKKSTRKK